MVHIRTLLLSVCQQLFKYVDMSHIPMYHVYIQWLSLPSDRLFSVAIELLREEEYVSNVYSVTELTSRSLSVTIELLRD